MSLIPVLTGIRANASSHGARMHHIHIYTYIYLGMVESATTVYAVVTHTITALVISYVLRGMCAVSRGEGQRKRGCSLYRFIVCMGMRVRDGPREQREFPADRRIDWLEIGKEY